MKQARSRIAARVVRKSASRRPPRNRARINYAGLFFLFFVSVLVSGGFTYALTTPSLVVAEVKIHGVELADPEAVEKAARTALGQNIILLRKSKIAGPIVRLPEVRQAKIGRRFPNHIWVRIWERQPYAALEFNGRFALLEQDGRVFHISAEKPQGVPLINAQCRQVKPGTTPDSEMVAYALEALTLAENQGMEPTKISVDPQGDMCLNMGSGFYVKLGQPDDIAKKVSLLRMALVCKPSLAQQASYIDLSCPSAAAWRPKASVAVQ